MIGARLQPAGPPTRATVGYKRAMTNARRFALDELTLRPGTYFNPQTEIMIVVDDSPEIDHELFDMDEFDSDEWVLIAEDIPLDESRRDDLVEGFQRTHQDPAAMVPKDERRARSRPRPGRGRGARRGRGRGRGRARRAGARTRVSPRG